MAKRRSILASPLLGVLVACGGGGGGGGGSVEVFVTTLLDAGPGSLRQVVADAPEGATVLFEPGLTGTVELASEISIDKDLRIEGPGRHVLTIAPIALAVTGLLAVEAGADVHVRSLRLLDGRGGAGGCVRSEGDLEMFDLIVEGGENTDRGGGVWSAGDLLMRACTIRGCVGFNGGGVACDGGSGRFESCTFEENSTNGNSGAALLVGQDVHVSCVNCTFGSNFTTGAGSVGGAIALFTKSDPARLDLSFCTISENTAGGDGGGIYVGGDCELRIRNCIVAGNSAGDDGPDVYLQSGASLTTLGHNVIGDGTDSSMADGVLGDQVGTTASPIDPMLDPRQLNGGSTETYALQLGSPALNTIPAADREEVDGTSVDEDQRGVERPVDGDADAGAYEGLEIVT